MSTTYVSCSACLPTGLAARTAVASAIAASGGARRHRPRFVDDQHTAAERLFVQLIDRRPGILPRRHLDKSKSARAAGLTLAHDADRLDGSRTLEVRLQIGVEGVEGK